MKNKLPNEVTRDVIKMVKSYPTLVQAHQALGVSYSFLLRTMRTKSAITEKMAEQAGWVRRDVWERKEKNNNAKSVR